MFTLKNQNLNAIHFLSVLLPTQVLGDDDKYIYWKNISRLLPIKGLTCPWDKNYTTLGFKQLCQWSTRMWIFERILYEINAFIFKTSLTSRDTCKESQNPSVNNIYLVGFNHHAKLLCKKWSQKTKPIWGCFM